MYQIFDISQSLIRITDIIPITIVISIFLAFSTYTDIKYYKVFNNFNLIMFSTRILTLFVTIPRYGWLNLLDSVIGAIVLSLFFLIPAMITYDSIGGDIKLAFNIGLWCGVIPSLIIAAIGTVLNVIFRTVFSKKNEKKLYMQKIINVYIPFLSKEKYPLAPFFFAGYLILIGISFYLR